MRYLFIAWFEQKKMQKKRMRKIEISDWLKKQETLVQHYEEKARSIGIFV